MSFFTNVEHAEHSFVAFAEKALLKFAKEAPTFITIVDGALTYIGPLLQVVVSAQAGTVAGAEVAKVVAEIQQDLTAFSGLVYDLGPNPTFANLLTSANNNLQSLLAAGHITNPVASAAIALVLRELNALAAAHQAAVSSAPVTSAAAIATPAAQAAAVTPTQVVSLTK